MAFAWELGGRRTEPFPFAAHDLGRGHLVEAEDVEWRAVPRGLIALPDLEGAQVAHPIHAGDPITAAAVTTDRPPPDDWWAVPMPLPVGVESGSRVRLILPAGSPVDGVVTTEASEDAFGLDRVGAVAVSAEHADAVAQAVATGSIMVLLRP